MDKLLFWTECQKFLDEVGTPVYDRRHGSVMHLAKAILVQDLCEQVQAKCPQKPLIPSESWIHLQFWPKTEHARSRIHYTGRHNVRFMLQSRQFSKMLTYAPTLFRYQREFAILLRDHSVFISLNDKHRIKVSELGFPVAAAECGQRVLVSSDATFEVGDHDFTRISMHCTICLLHHLTFLNPSSRRGKWEGLCSRIERSLF